MPALDLVIPPKYISYDELIERARLNGNSKQPRFSGQDTYGYGGWYPILRQVADTKEPAYLPDSMPRDRWLQEFRFVESHIAGVINQACLIYANRGWQITGGRNQVRKWTMRLHDSEGGLGWRYLIKRGALSFLTTDINCILEVEREGDVTITSEAIVKSPLTRLNNVDPGKSRLCREMTRLPGSDGKYLSTLNYNGQYWFDWDYIRVASLPSDREEFLGLGFCALSRAIRFVKLLYAVYLHDQEMMDDEMMDGLLILNNIREEQWRTAMEARREKRIGLELTRYGGVQVLTGGGEFGSADAKLIGLSQLPAGFNRETFIDQAMYGISLCFGFDSNEFWNVNAGVLGRGNETQIQHTKATAKGGEDFTLGLQEPLQKELPETIHFEFIQRDDQGELIEAEVAEAKATVINEMAAVRESTGPVLTNEQVMMLWAQAGLVPEEWTLTEEDVTSTDEEGLKERLLENPKIRSACEVYSREPIINYTWDGLKGRETVLWERGEDALRRRTWVLNRYIYRGDKVIVELGDLG